MPKISKNTSSQIKASQKMEGMNPNQSPCLAALAGSNQKMYIMLSGEMFFMGTNAPRLSIVRGCTPLKSKHYTDESPNSFYNYASSNFLGGRTLRDFYASLGNMLWHIIDYIKNFVNKILERNLIFSNNTTWQNTTKKL